MSSQRSFSLAAFALTMLAGLGLAAPGSATPGHGPRGFGLERQLAKLDLPAETRTAVQTVLDEARPQREALAVQIRDARGAMRALLEQATVDEAAVLEKADAIGALATERRKEELRTLFRVRELLAPEQRAELDRLIQARNEWRRHGFHGGRCARGEQSPQDASAQATK